MANTRIKDISTTTSTTNADDYIAIDGATSGTRKITASTLGGNFDENVVVEFGGNKTTYASNFLRSENGSYYIDAYNVGGDIVFRTSVASALDTQSMLIDGATGFVGIGGSPTYELDVTAANARIAATSTGGCVNHLQADNTGAYVGPLSNHNLYFKTNNITRATIDTGGNLILQKGGGAYLQLKDASAVRGSINVDTSDGLIFTTGASFTERMRIESTGVGILNSSPGDYFSNANALVVGTGADAHQGISIATNSDGGGHLYFMDGVAAAPGRISYYHTGNNMLFYTNDSERMRLTTNGDLAIGATSASSKLDITGTTNSSMMITRTSSGIVSNLEDAAGHGSFLLYTAGAGAKISLQASGNSYFNGGNVGISNSSPAHPLTLTANPGAANTPVAWLHNSGNVSEYDGTVISTVNDGSDVEVLHVRTNTTTYDGGSSLLLVRGDGSVGIGTASPGSYNSKADNLVVGAESGDNGITILTGTGNDGSLYFADSTGGNNRGIVAYNHVADNLQLGAGGGIRAKIWDGGDLEVLLGSLKIGTSGKGIDFSSGSTLDSYEVGTWSPVYTPASGSFTALTMNVYNARYVRVGKQVTVMAYILTNNLNTTGGTGNVIITGLPYANESSGYTAVSIGYASNWGTNHPAGGYVDQGASRIFLTERKTGIGGALTEMTVGNLNSSSSSNQNGLMFSATYTTA